MNRIHIFHVITLDWRRLWAPENILQSDVWTCFMNRTALWRITLSLSACRIVKPVSLDWSIDHYDAHQGTNTGRGKWSIIKPSTHLVCPLLALRQSFTLVSHIVIRKKIKIKFDFEALCVCGLSTLSIIPKMVLMQITPLEEWVWWCTSFFFLGGGKSREMVKEYR